MTRVRVGYFAQLRECAGKESETLETSAQTPRALYAELQERYVFPLDAGHVGIARNGAYDRSEAALADGDEIVFIPPIAGG